MLYLCNRSALRDKVTNDVLVQYLSDTVTVGTYQWIQERLNSGEVIEQYDYVIADEVHYFTSDANFNEYTNRSYDYLKSLSDCVVIYMSATAKTFFGHLITSGVVPEKNVFRFPKKYDYVSEIVFYRMKQLPALLDMILQEDQDSKAIVFCNSTKRMQKMKELYGDQAFYCSRWASKQLKAICDNSRVHEGTFDGRVLFTTSALDNGVDITDRRVRCVFSELLDSDKLVQSLGRRRMQDEEDSVSFYIAQYSNEEINRHRNTAKGRITMAEQCLKDRKAFFEKYGNDTKLPRRDRTFDWIMESNDGSGRLEVNRMMVAKSRMDIIAFKRMMALGYRPYVLELLGIDEDDERVRVSNEKETEKDSLMEYLRSIEGKRIYTSSDEMKMLKRHFETVAKLKYDKAIGAYNGIIEDCYPDYPYRFRNQNDEGKYFQDNNRKLSDGSPNPNYHRRYWLFTE